LRTSQNSGKAASTTPTRYHRERIDQNSKAALDMELPPVSPADGHHRFPSQIHAETTLDSRGDSVSQFPDSRVSLGGLPSPDCDSDVESEAYTSHTIPMGSRRTSGEDNVISSSRRDLRWEAAASADYHSHSLQPPLARHNIRATASLPARPRPMPQRGRPSVQLHPYVCISASWICHF
jgi:hypothetical protein